MVSTGNELGSFILFCQTVPRIADVERMCAKLSALVSIDKKFDCDLYNIYIEVRVQLYLRIIIIILY